MKSYSLVYICDGIGSVFDSQVISLLQSIFEKNYFCDVILLLGVRSTAEEISFQKKYSYLKFKTVIYKTYPNYLFFNSLSRSSLSQALKKVQKIGLKNAIYHTRGEVSAWHLMKILDKDSHQNILADVRGASIEEISEFYNFNSLLKFFKILNSRNAVKNLRHIQTISVVSGSLKKYLIDNFNIDKEKIFVVPCLAGSDFHYSSDMRTSLRKELALNENDTLAVFTTGGTASWQNNEIILRVAEKDIKVLNLSRKEINHKNIVNRFVEYSEIPAYLNAADVAIIWRDKSIVNKVASPVKFSEYVCCGLPVIANDTVDMIREYLINCECGILIDDIDKINVNNTAKLRKFNRTMISETAMKNFGLEAIVDRYLKIYSSINGL